MTNTNDEPEVCENDPVVGVVMNRRERRRQEKAKVSWARRYVRGARRAQKPEQPWTVEARERAEREAAE